MLIAPQRLPVDGAAAWCSGSVGRKSMGSPKISAAAARAEQESRSWIERLSATGAERDAALVDLHALLLRAARFEVNRRRAASPQLRGGDFEDLAQQSADDALVAILRKLDDFRGESRFTTWAYKFALYEAATKVRKRSWQGREITDRLTALHEAIEDELSPHQREVLVALALNEVPVDVLAERLNTTRGALYKTLHDARQKLRGALVARGMGLEEDKERTPA